ncbi:MAG: DUF4402 domain-containing protein [Croceibacterium sp.]
MGLGYFNRMCASARWTLGTRALCTGLAAGASALLATPASAQTAQTDTGTARTQVAILTRGSVQNVQGINFGKIIQANLPGTVILAPGPTATCTVTGGLIRSGVCRAAEFAIYGRRNNKVRIRENNGGGVTLNGPGGATMQMTNITFFQNGMTSVNGANGWNLGNYRIDTATGITEFYLGGTLNVGARQAAGVYHGTVIIEIQFN